MSNEKTLSLLEFRVTPVTRWNVTRYEELKTEGSANVEAGSSTKGTFDNPKAAFDVAYALCKDEHQRLGYDKYPQDDDRIQYPKSEVFIKEEIKRLLNEIEVGSLWRHSNGNVYEVLMFTNVEAERQDRYPTEVIYKNIANGKGYSRKITDWHRSMTLENFS